MMQDYLHSKATISERIAMGGRVGASQATGREIMETSKRETGKAVKDFDTKWESAASD